MNFSHWQKQELSKAVKLKNIWEDNTLTKEEKIVGVKEWIRSFINSSENVDKNNIQFESNYSVKDDNYENNIINKITTNILSELRLVNILDSHSLEKFEGSEKDVEIFHKKNENILNKGKI